MTKADDRYRFLTDAVLKSKTGTRQIPDYLSDRYASKTVLCKLIRDYWHTRGHSWVSVWTEQEELPGGYDICIVRSNITLKQGR